MENKTIKELYRELHPYLAHYGVLGMKWGVRRFQPYSLIPRKSGEKGKEVGAAKKSNSKGSEVKKTLNKVKVSDVKKSRTQKSKDAKKEYAKKANTAKQREAELNKVIKSGNAKAIYEHRSEMSTTQLKSAIDRLNTEAQLRSIMSDQNPSTIRKLKTLAGKADDINTIARSGINLYRTGTDLKKLAKDAADAKSDADKAAASAKVLKEVIGTSGTIDVKKAMDAAAKLSDKDLANLSKRITSESTMSKVNRTYDQNARDDRKVNEQYLKDVLTDYNTAKKNTEKEFSKVKLTDMPNGGEYDSHVNARTTARQNEVKKKNKKK